MLVEHSKVNLCDRSGAECKLGCLCVTMVMEPLNPYDPLPELSGKVFPQNSFLHHMTMSQYFIYYSSIKNPFPLSYSAAIPSIYHGRVVFVQDQHQGVTINRVEGVAVLDLGGTGVIVNHFFQCNTSTGSVNNLRWERENGNLPRFPQTILVNSQRLDMAPPGGSPVGYSDTGVYVCRDTVTGASASINITGGNLLVKFGGRAS